MFYCNKCGAWKECSDKKEHLLEKKAHRDQGCDLTPAPHKGKEILTRPQLALEAKKGKEIAEAYQLSLGFEDEDKNIVDEGDEGMSGNEETTNCCSGSV